MPQGAARHGPTGKSGRQGKKSKGLVQGDQSIHCDGLYSERRQMAQRTVNEILAPEKEFILPAGEQREMLHEDCHRQHARLALGTHRRDAPSEDG